MVETDGRRTAVGGHPGGRRAPDGGHRGRGRDPRARHRQDHHETGGIGRHDVSKGARQRRFRLSARGRLERHQPQAEHLRRQVHKRRPGQRAVHPQRVCHGRERRMGEMERFRRLRIRVDLRPERREAPRLRHRPCKQRRIAAGQRHGQYVCGDRRQRNRQKHLSEDRHAEQH